MEMKELKELENYFDDIYVGKDECSGNRDETNKRIDETNKELAKWRLQTELIKHDFDTLKRLGWAIASACIGQLVVSILGRIL